MNPESSLHRSLAALTHPASLLAMAILLLNDFVFKPFAPSWLTGKLSDFAGLIFLPLLLALLFSLLPLPALRRGRAAIFTALALTGIWFALVKTIPTAHAAFLSAAARVGMPVRMLLDPSDLMALAVLPLAYAIWRYTRPPVLPSRRAWAAVPLAALLLMADAAAPDLGVNCVAVIQGDLRLEVPYQDSYQSNDGGLTWQPHTEWQNYTCDSDGALMLEPAGPLQYRWVAGEKIERSTDGGATWTLDYQIEPLDEVRKAYVQKVNNQNAQFGKGPFGAVEDPQTGNIVFAMGHEGVLVRQASGTYTWVGIGEYNNSVMGPIPPLGEFTLLRGELFLTLAAGMLAFSTLALTYHRRWWRILKLIAGWLIWLFSLFILPPAVSSGPYTEMFFVFAILGALGWALLCVIDDLIGFARAHRWPSGRIYLYALLTGLAYFLPLLLWAYRLLSPYTTAVQISFGLVVVACAVGIIITRRREPVISAPA